MKFTKETITKKCHNCKSGFVDGGQEKRIRKEIGSLEAQQEKELSMVKEKNKDKKKIINDTIRNKYQLMIKEIDSQYRIKATCYYCNGTGYKK